jgi:acyl carrier protein
MTRPACDIDDVRMTVAQVIGRECSIAPESVDFEKSFAAYGLDSFAALTLSGELEDRLGVELPTTLLWDCPTPDALIDFVRARFAAPAAVAQDAFA